MSEQEKLLQIGRLAEEYGRLKSELNHVEQKLAHAESSYVSVGAAFAHLAIVNGALATPYRPGTQLTGLLGEAELIETLVERDLLRSRLDVLAGRLRSVAPNLV